ncbi:MAG: outer membrane lipoprotein - activator of MrcB activity [Sodalis sp. Fle]|nr:MAG: outer membrane lipoprotein - activator of MrcB activity [Sodalis sp. Fle]
MKLFLLISLTTLLLASCTTRFSQYQPATEPVPAAPPITSEALLIQPKIKSINWQNSLSPMIKQMMSVNGINNGSVLLINTMKNNTNGNVQTGKATATLTILTDGGNSKFNVVKADKLNTARQTLGLSANNSLESRSKAIWLARYLNAQYMLYSTASGDAKQPELDLQLILVQTGEIIWSSKGVAQ